MRWQCPECKRTFPGENQWHSCINKPYDVFMGELSQEVKPLMQEIMRHIEGFEKAKREIVKSGVLFKTNAAFLAIKPSRQWIDVDFILEHKNEEFPIYRILQSSKHKFWHTVRVDCMEEIDEQLIDWLNASYDLATT